MFSLQKMRGCFQQQCSNINSSDFQQQTTWREYASEIQKLVFPRISQGICWISFLTKLSPSPCGCCTQQGLSAAVYWICTMDHRVSFCKIVMAHIKDDKFELLGQPFTTSHPLRGSHCTWITISSHLFLLNNGRKNPTFALRWMHRDQYLLLGVSA